MNHIELLLLLRKYRFLYLSLFILASGIGGYFLIPWVLQYKGESTFYVTTESQINPAFFASKGQEDFLHSNFKQERLIQMIYSTEMMTFLIDKFDLYNVYDIDTGFVYAYEKAVRKLSRRIKYDKNSPDLLSVSVADRNNERAAAMTNALVYHLDQLNREYISNKLQGNLEFFDSYFKESASISNEQRKLLLSFMNIMRNNRKESTADNLSLKPLTEIEFTLYQSAAKIEDVTSQLILARNLYSQALTLKKSGNLPGLVVIKTAIPDLESKRPYLALAAVLTGMISCIFAICAMYFYNAYKDEFEIVFGRKPVDAGKVIDT